MTKSLDALLEDTSIRPFLPMLYVAWADGELSEHELQAFQDKTLSQSCLEETSKERLATWLDPQAPPTATELMQLLRHLRAASQDMENQERRTLAELGVGISQESQDEATLRALDELEDALGIVSLDHTREIMLEPEPMPVDTWRDLEDEANFDIQAMLTALEPTHQDARRKVREILSRDIFSYDYELSKADERERVLDKLRVLADEGIGALAYPTVLDSSKDMGEFLMSFQTLALGDISLVIKFGVQFGLFGGSIYFLGTQKHHDKYLADVASLKLPGCFAMTELGHGSNVRDLSTTATFDKATNEWVIHTPDELGRKEWIGNAAAHAQLATVFAQLVVDDVRYGVHAFLVPIRDEQGRTLPDVYIDDCGHKMGLNGVDNGRLWFDNVRVPADNLLDRFASVDAEGNYESPIASEGRRFFTMLGTLVGGRVSIAAASMMVTKSALTIAIRYAAMRRQFGPAGQPESPILNFRTHQRRLMPRLAKTYALNFAIEYLSERYLNKTEEDEREVEALAAGLKAYASWHCTDTVQTARECCGGQGYLTVNRLTSLKADTDIFTTFEGDNTVLLQLVAKSLLSEYAQQFQDLSFLSTLRFLANQATSVLTDLDPATPRRTDSAHLRDLDYHVALMKHREGHLLSSVARRFKRRLDDGMDSFQALIDVQDHMVATAKAHVERVILEQFVERTRAQSDEGVRAQLETLAALYALHHMEEGLAWYLENGLAAPAKAKAIRNEVNALCLEVREQCVHLVDAFGIPNELLAAPIAQSTIVPAHIETHTNS